MVDNTDGVMISVGSWTRESLAHVDYVTDPPETTVATGEFLRQVLSDPVNAVLVLAGVSLFLGVGLVSFRWHPTLPEVGALDETLTAYQPFVPLVARLAVGLSFIGAGSQGHLFALTAEFDPATNPLLRVGLIGIGVCLLFGFATRVFALVGLGVYLLAVATAPGVLLAMEYVPSLLAVFLLGPGRPSVDDLLGNLEAADGPAARAIAPIVRDQRDLDATVSPYCHLTPLVLRCGLGVAFIFLGLTQKIGDPARALAVVEKYSLTGLVPVDPGLLVLGVGLVEVALGLLLIGGLLTRPAAVVAVSVFVTTLLGLHDDPVLAHITFYGLGLSVFTLGAGPLSLDRLRHASSVGQLHSASPEGVPYDGSTTGVPATANVRTSAQPDRRPATATADVTTRERPDIRASTTNGSQQGGQSEVPGVRIADQSAKRATQPTANGTPDPTAEVSERTSDSTAKTSERSPDTTAEVADRASEPTTEASEGMELDEKAVRPARLIEAHRAVADRFLESGDRAYDDRDTETARKRYQAALTHLDAARELTQTFDIASGGIESDVADVESALERTQWQWGAPSGVEEGTC